MRKGTLGAGMATAVAIAAVASSVALADGATEVKVGLDPGPNGDAIVGKLKSDIDDCEVGRTVKVTYKAAGIKDVLGRDKTGQKGKFAVAVPGDGPYDESGFAAPGDYIAKVKRTKTEVDGETVTCKGGRGVYEHSG